MKSKLKEIINQCYLHKNGNRRFQYVITGFKDTYFVRDHSDAPQKLLRCRCHKDAGISNRHTLLPTFPSFRPLGMVGEACLPSKAYYLRTSDTWVHICWSEHSDSSFVYGFMSLDYGLGTMPATTLVLPPVLIVGFRYDDDKKK